MQLQNPQPLNETANHNISLQARKQLTASGVKSITSYDEYVVVLETELGTLQIGGEGISVSELSVQTGEVQISGKIEYLQYSNKTDRKKGFWGRVIR